MKELYSMISRLGKKDVILDVRRPEEFAEGHIHGSINIDHESVTQHIDQLKKYETIYIHCRSGKRSQLAAASLTKAGFSNLVCINDGGMMDWIEAGYPVEK